MPSRSSATTENCLCTTLGVYHINGIFGHSSSNNKTDSRFPCLETINARTLNYSAIFDNFQVDVYRRQILVRSNQRAQVSQNITEIDSGLFTKVAVTVSSVANVVIVLSEKLPMGKLLAFDALCHEKDRYFRIKILNAHLVHGNLHLIEELVMKLSIA